MMTTPETDPANGRNVANLTVPIILVAMILGVVASGGFYFGKVQSEVTNLEPQIKACNDRVSALDLSGTRQMGSVITRLDNMFGRLNDMQKEIDEIRKQVSQHQAK